MPSTPDENPAVPHEPRTKRTGANIALAIVSLLIALALAELLLRLLGVGKPPKVMVQSSTDIYIQSPVEGLNYEFRPGFEGFAYGCNVKINSHGMRAPECPVEKPAGTRRVLLLGDSVTFGQGVAQSDIVSVRLQDILSSGTAEGETVEVLNAAVPGYNSEQEYLALREKRLAFNPDVVVVIAVINDVEPAYHLDANGNLAWDELPDVYQDVIENEYAVRGITGWLRMHLRIYAVIDRAFRRPYVFGRKFFEYNRDLYADDAPAWQSARASIRAMRVLCKARGIGFVLAYSPMPARPEPEVYRQIREKYKAFAGLEGIPFVDFGEAFKGIPVKRYVLTQHDLHPNAFGHGVMAKALAPPTMAELRKSWPLPKPSVSEASGTSASKP